jgi:hypothetical protein
MTLSDYIGLGILLLGSPEAIGHILVILIPTIEQ